MKKERDEKRVLLTLPLDSNLGAIKSMNSFTHIIVRKRSYAIELDLGTYDLDNTIKHIAGITKIIGCKEIEGEEAPAEGYLKELLSIENQIIDVARFLFNEERYWEAHTVLEDLWKASRGEKKEFMQALILIAASMTHYQMGETEIAIRMYKKAINKMKKNSYYSTLEQLDEEFKYPFYLVVKK